MLLVTIKSPVQQDTWQQKTFCGKRNVYVKEFGILYSQAI